MCTMYCVLYTVLTSIIMIYDMVTNHRPNSTAPVPGTVRFARIGRAPEDFCFNF